MLSVNKMNALSRVIVISAVAMAVMAGRIRRQETDNFDLTETRTSQNCISKNGKEGICVHHSYCNNEHEILTGGNIINIDLREKNDCYDYEWCCTLEDVEQPPKLNVSSSEKCLATSGEEEYSWFVALFKSTTDTQSAPRIFCAGALVTSRVVLTAGTCLKSAQKSLLYVQVPASKSPQNYTVQNRRLHRDYNSGTHVNDFGILVLDKDVNWGDEKNRNVCLDFQTLSQGYCFSVGFAQGDIVTTTILSVEAGGCRRETNGTGVSCGANADRDCIVTPGAPVLCRSKDAVYTVVGVTKSNCRNEKVLIGDISSVSAWFKEELSAMNVMPKTYTYNKS